MSIATDSDYVALSEKYGAIYYCPKGHLYANFKTANSFHCNACDDVKAARVEALREASKLAEDHTWVGVPGGAQAVMDAIDKLIKAENDSLDA